MKEIPESTLEKFQSISNYILNRFMPWLIIGFIVFTSFGLWDVRPYVVLGLLAFVERYCYKVGYSVCLCKQRGLLEFPEEDSHLKL